MKKVSFNRQYGLLSAVISGSKIVTRRISKNQINPSIEEAKWKIGEVIAVAQSYEDMANEGGYILANMLQDETTFKKEYCGAGWRNAMFTKPDLMPHRIKITNIRIERLQDISEKDCLKEGFAKINVNNGVGNMLSHWEYRLTYEDKLGRSLQLGSRDHKEAFGILIDKICGNGTWESNPWVFVYNFELIK